MDFTGATQLHEAVWMGRMDAVKSLLASNTDIDAKDIRGMTPLQWAAQFGNKDAAAYLLAKHADRNATNRFGETPLHRAVWKGHEDVVALLLASNVAVNARDNVGATPLHDAAANGKMKTAELLIASKADVNAKDSAGWTPLHVAAWHRQLDIMKLLLENKAEVNAEEANGLTPLQLASQFGYNDEVTAFLRQHGGQDLPGDIRDAVCYGSVEKVKTLLKVHPELVHSKGFDGLTPLHETAMQGRDEMAALLLANNADVNAKDNHGETPLDLALSHKDMFPKEVELLLAHNAEINIFEASEMGNLEKGLGRADRVALCSNSRTKRNGGIPPGQQGGYQCQGPRRLDPLV
jgi:ankyrin repeat protein